jgi:hypothetical protein
MGSLNARTLVFMSAALAGCMGQTSRGGSAEERIEDTTPAGHVCTDPAHLGEALPCATSAGTPRYAIDRDLLANRAVFDSEFYGRFTPHEASLAVDVIDETTGEVEDTFTKTYPFPTLYGDVTTAIAMFFCRFEKAKELMPDPALVPVDMGFGRSLVVFSSYRYNRVNGIAPYNEIAISIPVVTGHLVNVPVLPLLAPNYRGLGFYVISMPVTSSENNQRGHGFWGLPKVVQPIELRVDDGDYVTTVREKKDGPAYLEFRVPMEGDATPVDNLTYLYSELDDAIVRSPSHVHGDFTSTRWLKELLLPTIFSAHAGSKSTKPFRVLGDSPSGKVLQDLGISEHPFEVRFANGTESVFDLPDRDFSIPLAP